MDATPGGIEASEKRGQTELVNSTNIPIEMHPGREAFEAVGFTFGDAVDELFVSATLPVGWTREATGHSMHSNILDDNGRVRVSVFYKAAFYDRRANCHLVQRYKIDSYAELPDDRCAVSVMDGGKELRRFGDYKLHDYKAAKPLEEQAKTWLDEAFPNAADPTAYWAEA